MGMHPASVLERIQGSRTGVQFVHANASAPTCTQDRS